MRILAIASTALCLSGTLLLAGCDVPPPPAPVTTTPVAAIDTPPPAYPMELACDGIGGKVALMLTIGTDGSVTRVVNQHSSGHVAFDTAAQEAVRSWRFRAATRNGEPVETQISVPVTFNAPPEEPEDCYYLGR